MADSVRRMEALGRFLAWTLVLLVLAVGALRLFVFEPWTVPDDDRLAASVAPTLAAGDTVLLLSLGTPRVGDLVRCTDPEKSGGFMVARVVAKGGDQVAVDGDTVTVNRYVFHPSERCEENDLSVTLASRGRRATVECRRLEMAGGSHFIGRIAGVSATPVESVTVARGRLFLVSDNRSAPHDSRDFGEVPLASCDRRVVFRAWSARGWSDVARRLTPIH